jgi:glycosyltransferase involved in cell wall biosynthesis
MSSPRISVVLGTFNLKDKLISVIESLDAQTLPKEQFEVIIADSSSTDGTKAYVEGLETKLNIRIITLENRGKAYARNCGVKDSQADLVLITDADMIAHPDFVKQHLDRQIETGRNIALQGKTWVLTEESLPPVDVLRRPYITHKVNDGQPLGFYYFLTGNLSLPKRFFEQYGYFDESFENYGWEDVELGYRLLKKHGESLQFLETAENYHLHVWSDYEELERREKMGESVHLVLSKHPELASFLGVNIINKGLYRLLSSQPDRTSKWIEQVKSAPVRPKFKYRLLKEYFYQKGYLSTP